ncbi:RNA ligase [Ruegeria phage RpAliso]|nr:RNA ligase [Ruegeria phage RpAliso]
MDLSYKFPIIERLDDILPHIDDNFMVVVKEGLTFVNYKLMGEEVFPSFIEGDDAHNHRAAIRRECRGIVFDSETGRIVSRPFHKFFNAEEREGTALVNINTSIPHVILDKLDGSMLRPLPMPGGFRWGTKMGLSDTALKAEEYVCTRPQYDELARVMHLDGVTPLFEFCSNSCRIVVAHPEESMVLLALRDNITGEYFPMEVVEDTARNFGVPCVSDHGRTDSISVLVNDVRARTEGEGIVLAFNNGHRIKVKSDWYVRVHKAKDMIRAEADLLDLFFNDQIDDLMPHLTDYERWAVNTYIADFGSAVDGAAAALLERFDAAREAYPTRPEMAKAPLPKSDVSLFFNMWNGKAGSPKDAILNEFRRRVTRVSDTGVTTHRSPNSTFAAVMRQLGVTTRWNEIWEKGEIA